MLHSQTSGEGAGEEREEEEEEGEEEEAKRAVTGTGRHACRSRIRIAKRSLNTSHYNKEIFLQSHQTCFLMLGCNYVDLYCRSIHCPKSQKSDEYNNVQLLRVIVFLLSFVLGVFPGRLVDIFFQVMSLE